MLDAATMTDPAMVQKAGRQGQDPDHRWRPRSLSQRSDSASSSSSSEWWHILHQDERDLQDVIHTKNARGQIESH
jgi:hypothetical protein